MKTEENHFLSESADKRNVKEEEAGIGWDRLQQTPEV